MSTPVQSPVTFDDLAALIVAGDSAGVVAFFTGMPERQRRALVKPLRAHLKSLSWRAVDGRETWEKARERRGREGRPVLLAGVATAASAGSVAKWIRDTQRQAGGSLAPIDPVVKVLADRDPEWLPELPAALTATLEWFGGLSWRLAEAVAALSGTTPTATHAYVVAWAGHYTNLGRGHEKGTIHLRDDPRLDEFLPRLFEDDEGDFFLTPWSPFRKAVEVLVTEGRVPREVVLDGVLSRLLRGGRPGDLTNIMAWLDVLEPTTEEYLARISSCISLLSAAHGPVARYFLDVAKQLSDAGKLDVELAVEGASIAVTRSEKNVVRTALSWLDGLVTRHPDRAAEIIPVIATAFANPAPDLQQRAAKLVAKRKKLLGADDCASLVDSGRLLLPSDLAAALATSLGVAEEPEAVAPLGFPDISPYVPRPMPGPIATPEEAAEVLSALLWRGPDDAMVVERFLEAVVEFSRTDPAGLRAAFEPVVERTPVNLWQRQSLPYTPQTAVQLLAEAAVGTDAARVPHRTSAGTLWGRSHEKSRNNRLWGSRVAHNGPLDIFVLRVMELAGVLGAEGLPSLVAVPTAANGSIDPAVLAERLRACEAEGRLPLSVDFQQALLRLPHDCGSVDGSDLSSEAGREFAAWIGGERPELPTVRRTPYKRDYAWGREPGLTLRSSAMPAGMVEQSVVPEKVETLFDVVRAVWDAPGQTEHLSWNECLPAVLPSDPDLVAVSLAPPLHLWSREGSPTVPALLAEADDARHDALHFVIADRLVGGDAPGRAGAVDAALVLASRGQLDGALLAADMVSLLTTTESAGLRKAVPCLRDLANGGAARQVWDVIAGTVTDVLPPRSAKALTGAAELLALGTEIAGALGVTGAIPAVAELAARKGSGTVQAAARRLNAALTGS